MTEKQFCGQHSGFQENIRELCEFKKSMTASGIGTIDRIWEGIEKKVSKGILVTFAVLVMTLVTTLFGLVYHSNSKVLHEMVSIKSNITLIMEKLK
jgi:hypothetical protein